MLKKVLIANRGEIAVRVIRACHELGIKTVAVYSQADQDALHVSLATEAVCIGPARADASYLNKVAILSAAVATGADAIHPGFGFLSENSDFAKMCAEMNIKFIGPSPEVIDVMGNKANARQTMIDAGVPVIPGCEGTIIDVQDALFWANKIGYPVLLKAVAGGGGKGMRRVFGAEEMESVFNTASQEAQAAFGDGRLYMEKIVRPAHHIEFQILADQHGNVIHVGERDCSLQRNHQKVLEESPSPYLDETLRLEMGKAAVRAAKGVGYENAGTIEFLVDEAKQFYFMEMNTRIQVEHPVSEMVSGLDLVEWQLRIAGGEVLTILQEDVQLSGHAIECRINAENPKKNFMPSSGTVEFVHFPGGRDVRVESAVYSGYMIPPYYDAMIAKIIVKADNRELAIEKMKVALSELYIDGIDTNIEFEEALLRDEAFVSGKFDTDYLQQHFLPKYQQ